MVFNTYTNLFIKKKKMRKIKIYPDLYSIIQLTYKQISKNNQFASFPQVQFDDISSLN